MKKARQVCREMFIGLGIWALFLLILLPVLCIPLGLEPLAMAAGVVLGTASAVLMIMHMYKHLDIALDMDAGHAQRYAQKASMFRLAFMAFVMGGAFYFWRYIHPAGVIFGILGIKITAFLNPFIHSCLTKKKDAG